MSYEIPEHRRIGVWAGSAPKSDPRDIRLFVERMRGIADAGGFELQPLVVPRPRDALDPWIMVIWSPTSQPGGPFPFSVELAREPATTCPPDVEGTLNVLASALDLVTRAAGRLIHEVPAALIAAGVEGFRRELGRNLLKFPYSAAKAVMGAPVRPESLWVAAAEGALQLWAERLLRFDAAGVGTGIDENVSSLNALVDSPLLDRDPVKSTRRARELWQAVGSRDSLDILRGVAESTEPGAPRDPGDPFRRVLGTLVRRKTPNFLGRNPEPQLKDLLLAATKDDEIRLHQTRDGRIWAVCSSTGIGAYLNLAFRGLIDAAGDEP